MKESAILADPKVIFAKPMNKRCKISKLCSRKGCSDRNMLRNFDNVFEVLMYLIKPEPILYFIR